MKIAVSGILSVVFFVNSYAQSFTFSELHPTHKPDSLEYWLKTHRTPSPERLKNLIILGRTYTSSNFNKLITHIEEINQLSEKLNSQIGKASYYYLKAFYYNQQQQSYSASNELQKALNIFQQAQDNAGLLHCYSQLLITQFSAFSENKIQTEILKKQYLNYIDRYLGNSPDVHNYLQAQFAKIFYELGRNENKDGKKSEEMVRKTLEVVDKNKEASYAYFRLNIYLAVSYYFQNRIADAYTLNKNAEANLRPNQTHELVFIYFNLSNDCLKLEKNEECIEYCRKGLDIISRYEPTNYSFFNGFYWNLKEISRRRGDLNEALAMADSTLKYEKLVSQKNNNMKMLELQGQYEFERNQHRIGALEKEQRSVILLLIAAGTVIAIIAFLMTHLYRTNKLLKVYTASREQLFGMIAHDLRRPMHAFHGMSELVSFYLKKKDYKSIERFSQSLDESGEAIQRILDNLLSWVISQGQLLPYNPVEVPLSQPLMNVVKLYQKVSVTKEITFDVICPEELTVYADPNAIELIIRNLLDNSYKALMPQGKISIHARNLDTNCVEVEISDNGPGVPTEKLAVIRKVFLTPQQAFVGIKGMGLGLIMVGRFMKQNKGHIRVVSSLSHGTTFTLQFPANSVAASKA